MRYREKVHRARVRGADKIKRLLAGPISGGLPQSYIRSIEESGWNSDIRKHVLESRCVTKSQVLHFDFDPKLPLWFRRSKALDSRYAYCMTGVTVSPRSGMVWSDRYIFGESIGSLNKVMSFGRCSHEPLMKRHALPAGKRVVPCGNHGYYHFLTETLPSVLLSKALWADAFILLPLNPPRYIEEALAYFLGASWRKQCLFSDLPVNVSEAVFVATSEHSGFMDHDELDILRKFLPEKDTNTEGDKLYISRAHSIGRRVDNESEIHALFESQGFRVVYMEDLSFQEQVDLISKAKVVAGLHGAGLTNILFGSNGLSLIELFAPGVFNDCFARMSSQIGFSYTPIFLEAQGEVTAVDIDALKNSLSR